MTWDHLLFAHWPVRVDDLRPHIPPSLDIDTFDNTAWLGIVPFVMDKTRPRALPGLPTTTTFPELNVRTYVTPRHDDTMPGVWFVSLDAASRLAVRLARRFFGLPYFDARMTCAPGDQGVRYQSNRTDRTAPAAAFDATYAGSGTHAHSSPGSLEHFLTERYCLYAERLGTLMRGHIHHPPWALRPATAEVRRCEMTSLLNITLPNTDPILHAARRIDVVAWWPETCSEK